jgi:hypothetical protein
MSAEILDNVEDLEEVEQQLPDHTEAATPEELIQSFSDETAAPVEPEPTEYDLPDKYRGKSIKEVVEMHQSAESLIGKHSAEVGELRQFVDGYIKGKLNDSPEAVTETSNDEVDFFEDPDAAVNRAIDRHPAVQEAKKQAQQYKNETALSSLQAKHTDLAEIISDPTFATWVNSSKVRQELYQRADKGYDTDSADELISNFKVQRSVAVQTVAADKQSRQSQVRAASTGSARGSAPQNMGVSGKTYRRQDLIKLMVQDPARYESLSDEILKAYSEGRVR